MKIKTFNNSKKEKETKKILLKLLHEYDIPHYAEKVMVRDGVTPRSYPVLTLNTRTNDEKMLLKMFVHGQIHWFTAIHPKYHAAIKFLKQHYEDNGECNVKGQNSNSFWEHLIVCFNTRLWLQNNVPKSEIDYIYSQWQPYPETEKLVESEYTKIHDYLKQFDIIIRT